MKKVLCVDGPAAGKVVDAEGRYTLLVLDRMSGLEHREVLYNIHRFVICGVALWLASLETLAERIDQKETFRLITSAEAKMVVDLQWSEV